MLSNENLKEDWEALSSLLEKDFGEGEALELDAIIYLVGIQEYGNPHRRFKKDDKIDLMHIAICRLLEPYGYYRFSHIDQEGWPHYDTLADLPPLKSGEQTILMKEALVNYFKEKDYLTTRNQYD